MQREGVCGMANYNFKVVAELRKDLTVSEKDVAMDKIDELQRKLKIVKVDETTYCKVQPIKDYDDFGAVAFFFSALKDMKGLFIKLEYYDLWEGDKSVAV